MRVLLAEDEINLAERIARGLRREGLEVDVVGHRDEALEKVRADHYDVIVLDMDSPRVDGDQVCRAIRVERPQIRIVMLSGEAGLADLVECLAIGADQYMSKPLRFPELVARIRALGRRSSRCRRPVLTHRDLELDPATSVLTRGGRQIRLTGEEVAVLSVLMRAAGASVSVETLVQAAPGMCTDPSTAAVRTTIRALQRKLGHPAVIETVVRTGYRLV